MISVNPNPLPDASPAATPINKHVERSTAPAQTCTLTTEPHLVDHDHAARLGDGPSPTTTNPDCLALGCEWDWGTQRCACGRSRTYRICTRCLFSDDDHACSPDTDNDHGDGEGDVWMVAA